MTSHSAILADKALRIVRDPCDRNRCTPVTALDLAATVALDTPPTTAVPSGSPFTFNVQRQPTNDFILLNSTTNEIVTLPNDDATVPADTIQFLVPGKYLIQYAINATPTLGWVTVVLDGAPQQSVPAASVPVVTDPLTLVAIANTTLILNIKRDQQLQIVVSNGETAGPIDQADFSSGLGPLFSDLTIVKL